MVQKILSILRHAIRRWREKLLSVACSNGELGDLSPAKLRWLAREIGEPLESISPELAGFKPKWNKDQGRLYWNGEVIRVIRSTLKAVNVVKVLDAFEQNNWPTSVANPPDHLVEHDLRETVRSLNRGLRQIRFETVGMKVRWRSL